jgi:hypothetical protein
MATNEMENRCGLSLDAASSLKWKKKMRLDPFVQHQQHDAGEAQAPVPGKGLRPGAMAGQKLRAAQPLADGGDKQKRGF